MKCYEKITGKYYESSHDIVTEANNRFHKTVRNEFIGTIDEYFFWIINILNCSHLEDIDYTYTMCKDIYGDTIGMVKFDTAMDENDDTPVLIIDFIPQRM